MVSIREIAKRRADSDTAHTSYPMYDVEEWQEGKINRWTLVERFFSRAGAEDFIWRQKHNHRGQLRVYVTSAYRNPEMQAIQALLAEHIKPSEQTAAVLADVAAFHGVTAEEMAGA